MNKMDINEAAERVLAKLDAMSDEDLFAALEMHKDGPISRAVSGSRDNGFVYQARIFEACNPNREELLLAILELRTSLTHAEESLYVCEYAYKYTSDDASNDPHYQLAA